LAATPFLLFPERLPPATIVALILVAAGWLLGWRYFPVTPFNDALLLWEVALLVSIAVSADPDQTLPKATGLILGLAVWRLVSLLAGLSERSFRWAGLLYLLLALGFVLLGILGADWRAKVPVLQQFIDLLPGVLVQLPGASDAGVQLNQLAGTILLLLPLTISLAVARGWNGERRAWRIALAILSLILGGLLLFSQSRGGWLGLVIGVGAMGLLWWLVLPAGSRRRLGLMLLASLVAVLIIAAVIGPAGLQRLWEEPPRETAVGNLNSILFRQEVWHWSLEAIEDFPFTGLGLGAFRRAAPRLYPLDVPYDYDIAHAHNIFLQVALDTGLPGLVAYIAVLALALVVGLNIARRSLPFRAWALGLLGCLCALHAFGLADALAPGSKPGLLFWLMLGLLAAMQHQTRAR
jgi:putative inorganic carbon (HCO3(-)) transporter